MTTLSTEQAFSKAFQSSILIKSATEDANGEWIVNGVVSSLNEDTGDVLTKSALERGLAIFQKLGKVVDWENRYRASLDLDDVIGKGIQVRDHAGKTYLVTQLFKSKPFSVKLWNHIRAGGDAHYELHGVVKARSPQDRARVLDCEVHRVSIFSGTSSHGDTNLKIGSPFERVVKSLVDDVAFGDFTGWQAIDPKECQNALCVEAQEVPSVHVVIGKALRAREEGFTTSLSPMDLYHYYGRDGLSKARVIELYRELTANETEGRSI